MLMTIISIFVGAFIANLVGAGWYGLLASPWQKAAKITKEDIESTPGYLMFLYPLGLS